MLVLLATMLLIASGGTGVGYADPLNPSRAPQDDTTLGWPEVGLPAEVTLLGANNARSFTVPIPAGFTPRRLRGLIHAPVDFGAGFVEINDSAGTSVATIGLPAPTPEQIVVPFDVDISAARITAQSLVLTFTVRESQLLPLELRCGLNQQVELKGLAVALAGTEPAPTSIASFFPEVLQRLTIYTPLDTDRAEEQAVLALTSAVAREYRPQTPAIAVVKQPRGAAPPPAPEFTRAVVVETGDAGMDLVNPGRADVFLRITGRGDELAAQTALVADGLQTLVQGSQVRIEGSGEVAARGSDEFSFGQLDLAGGTEVLRTGEFTVGLDKSSLGAGRVGGVKVHLLATYTPVSPADAASLTVVVNDQDVYSTALGDSGRLDTEFDVPGTFLRQRINVTFRLTFSPRQLCSPMIAPLTFQLDPRSSVSVRRGGPAAGGFAAVPSEFTPEFLVALDGSSPDQLNYAARVVAGIAGRTGEQLSPRLVDVKAAADATTGALIVANAATVAQTPLRPPISGEPDEVRFGTGEGGLQVQMGSGLGSLQAFADEAHDRTVILVTTNGPWTLVEPVLAYIDQQPDRWSSLSGNVLAAGRDGTVTDVSIGVGEAAVQGTDDRGSWTVWAVLGGVCLAVAALAVGLRILLRRRASG